MKMKFLIVVFCHALSFAYAQWEQVHPAGSLNRFMQYGRVTDNGNQWMVVGNNIATSDDSGETWTSKTVNLPLTFKPDRRYTDVTFVNDDLGFMVNQSQIFRTTDGGVTWTSVLSLQPSHDKYLYSAYFHAIAFMNETDGYAVGDFEKIFHTTDGGDHWEEVSWSAATKPFIAYTDITVGEHNEIYIGGYEVSDILMNFGFDEFVMSSVDNGVRWTRSLLPTGHDFRSIEIQVTGDQEYFVQLSRTQASDQLFFTSDNGVHWDERTPSEMKRTRTLECLPNGVVLAWGDDHLYQSVMYRSSDFGDSWTTVALPVFSQQDDYAITDIVFENPSSGFAVGAGGSILTTNDAGQSWQVSNAGYPAFYSIDMVDGNIGFASGGIGFFKTTDGGLSWEFLPDSDSLTILDMSFESPGQGIFFGWKNFYYHVSQQGALIQPITLPVNFTSLSNALLQGDSLFVCGWTSSPTRNVFMRSGDRGEHWSMVDVPGLSAIVSQFQRVGNDFYFSTTAGIRRSDSKGGGWRVISDFTQEYLEPMIVIDDQIIVGYFSSGSVKRSIDGGQHWQSVGDFSSTTTVKDFIRAGNIIFAYGWEIHDDTSLGAIWRSVDKGATWEKEELPLCDNVINDMNVVGDRVYATGGYGLIFKLDLEGEITGVEGKSSDVLATIYPVPAIRELFVVLEDNILADCALLSVTGKSVIVSVVRTEDSCWRVDLSAVPPGAYVLSGRTSGGPFRRRVVIVQ
jgi:photosystem II stability/assembly factor-like uncharacterized protein